MTPAPERACRRAATLALFVAVGAATSGLPASMLPSAWLAALLAPGAAFGLLPRASPRPLARVGLAAALQLGACVLAYRLAGPIDRPAALAGTILPPMAFVTVRRHEADAMLGLFLGFCVLLVGTILGGEERLRLLVCVAAAAMQLRCEARLTALRTAAPGRLPERAAAPWRSGLWLGALCALVVTAVQHTLPLVPSQARARGPALHRDQPRRSIGLPEDFDLGAGGGLLAPEGGQLLAVEALDGGEVPQDLYLRSGCFQEPGLDGWRAGPLAVEVHDAAHRQWRLRAPLPAAPVRRLAVIRGPAARNFVFVPPGLCAIAGLADLRADPARDWFQEPRPGGGAYEVEFQQLPAPDGELRADPRWQDLLALPPDLDRRLFAPLLAEWRPEGGPLSMARSLAALLQARCRYAPREPTGPHGHALLDFLFGDRTGFCMHFASAAAILLRMAGVPCRIGVGVYGGSAGSSRGARAFGSQHAHAWVEIPIEGRGFLVFDPTPPAGRGARSEAAAAPDADDPRAAGAATVSPRGPFATLRRWSATPWPWLAVPLWLLLSAARNRRVRRAAALPLPPAARPARRFLLRILGELGARGHPRARGATLEGHAARLAAAGALPPDLRAAFAAYQEVRFGGRPWDAARQQRMASGLAAARLLPLRAPVPRAR